MAYYLRLNHRRRRVWPFVGPLSEVLATADGDNRLKLRCFGGMLLHLCWDRGANAWRFENPDAVPMRLFSRGTEQTAGDNWQNFTLFSWTSDTLPPDAGACEHDQLLNALLSLNTRGGPVVITHEQPLPDIRGLAQDLVRLAHAIGYRYDEGDWVKQDPPEHFGEVTQILDAIASTTLASYELPRSFVQWMQSHRPALLRALQPEINASDRGVIVAQLRPDGDDWVLVFRLLWPPAGIPLCFPYQLRGVSYVAMQLKTHPDKLGVA